MTNGDSDSYLWKRQRERERSHLERQEHSPIPSSLVPSLPSYPSSYSLCCTVSLTLPSVKFIPFFSLLRDHSMFISVFFRGLKVTKKATFKYLNAVLSRRDNGVQNTGIRHFSVEKHEKCRMDNPFVELYETTWFVNGQMPNYSSGLEALRISLYLQGLKSGKGSSGPRNSISLHK